MPWCFVALAVPDAGGHGWRFGIAGPCDKRFHDTLTAAESLSQIPPDSYSAKQSQMP